MKRLLVALTVVLVLAATASAQDVSLAISFTIPVIPGVNAPPLEGQTVQNEQLGALRQAQIEEALAAAEQAQNLIFAKVETSGKIFEMVYSK